MEKVTLCSLTVFIFVFVIFVPVLCVSTYVTVFVLSASNSLGLAVNSHPASRTESFYVSITDQV